MNLIIALQRCSIEHQKSLPRHSEINAVDGVKEAKANKLWFLRIFQPHIFSIFFKKSIVMGIIV